METNASGNTENWDSRSGILAGGSWIVDQVKIIDTYPGQDQLANISGEEQGTGGSPFNVLVDLAQLGATFPLIGCGKMGLDAPADWALSKCKNLNIDTSHIHQDDSHPTSYTLVMTVQSTGRRTFFHHPGANAFWDGSELDLNQSNARIFHLGYLLLLDELDKPDPDYGTKAAALLCRAQKAGLQTSLDVVSEDSDRFATIVKPALKYTDYAILNEIEAGKSTGFTIREADNTLNKNALEKAVDAMFDAGVKELAVVHFPEGAYAQNRDGERFWQPSLQIPNDFIQGGAGAGDAFCAGTLFGVHEKMPIQDSLKLGVKAAASCLSHPTCTEGVTSLNGIKKLEDEFGFRPSI